jgi:hypothetical protein
MRVKLLPFVEGLFSYSVDFALWVTIYLADLSVPQSRNGQIWRARIAADKFLSEINYEVIKNGIQTARKRGWIKIVKKRGAMPEITDEGMRRLKNILPTTI